MPCYYRPSEVDYLLADASKAKAELRWEARVRFGELVRIMLDADLTLAGITPPGEAAHILSHRFNGWHGWEHQVATMEQAF
jgi:GDPmannose 4,6-dehydratase